MLTSGHHPVDVHYAAWQKPHVLQLSALVCGSQTLQLDVCHMQCVPVVQVEATKGALWDAFAETAIFMEILHVQTSSSDSAKGEQQLTHRMGPAGLHVCIYELNNP